MCRYYKKNICFFIKINFKMTLNINLKENWIFRIKKSYMFLYICFFTYLTERVRVGFDTIYIPGVEKYPQNTRRHILNPKKVLHPLSNF